jgi:hypothetical protein
MHLRISDGLEINRDLVSRPSSLDTPGPKGLQAGKIDPQFRGGGRVDVLRAECSPVANAGQARKETRNLHFRLLFRSLGARLKHDRPTTCLAPYNTKIVQADGQVRFYE